MIRIETPTIAPNRINHERLKRYASRETSTVDFATVRTTATERPSLSFFSGRHNQTDDARDDRPNDDDARADAGRALDVGTPTRAWCQGTRSSDDGDDDGDG